MTLLIVSHQSCSLHDMGAGHPECPARLDAVQNALAPLAEGSEQDSAGLAPVVRLEAPAATREQLQRAHLASHVTNILDNGPADGLRQLDPDTAMNPHTADAALHAAGAVVAGVEAVCAGEATRAFCPVRPPGHHAERHRAMGFCFFNNVAVGALHALDALGLSRVAIVDFDVHHGNGTENIFQDDARVLMVSSFQTGLYPGSGDVPLGPNMKNIPLPAGSDGSAVRDACVRHWIPDLRAFAPELIMISAGFDAHRDDHLASLNWQEEDYGWLTEQLVELAVGLGHGRIVSVLEGGYALDALGRSVAAHVAGLMVQH